MGKEIFKFRAWWLKDEGAELSNPTMLSMNDIFNYVDPQYPIESGDIIIMQYTGLKDIHGKEIYEGDIVANFNFDDADFRSEVEYKNGAFGYKSQVFDIFIGFESNTNFKWHNGKSEKVKVIGNIYENPELLEG